jgi:glycerol-3-phosphate O-acyltransferase
MDKRLKPKGLKGKYLKIFEGFCNCYRKVVPEPGAILQQFAHLLEKQLTTPFVFEPYHQKVPLYHEFGLNFMRPLVDLDRSSLSGEQAISAIEKQLALSENVILLANHQTESDPFLISILLEKGHAKLGEKIIYVAGERVTTDPLAIPFSIGCNLLCIYSKRYIDHPPELKAQKQSHNKRTMELMSRLLEEGGKIIYVAPSGGRDRSNAEGIVEVAPFDPSSVEMMYLMAKRAKRPAHFYPLSLDTYNILPPPESVQKELGEARLAARSPIHIAFGDEFDMERFPGYENQNKIQRRLARADALWTTVNQNYQRIR